MVKRLFDLLFAALALFVLLPLFIILAILLKIDSQGPVFYRPQRVGLDGRLYRLFKFRTMVPRADEVGPGITRHGDPRITRVGRWLRKFKLDELPQFINVLLGDMSVVGPRPEDPDYVDEYTQDQRRILEVKPGVTSAASLQYRDEESLLVGEEWEGVYLNQVMPDKLRIDIEYMRDRTFFSDLGIIWRTFLAIFE